jgi:hypothetical protein
MKTPNKVGRKSLKDELGEPVVEITIRIPESQHKHLKTKGKSIAATIRRLIAQDMQRPS